MEDEKYERIMDGIKNLEIGQAVTNEKMDNMGKYLKKTNSRLDHANDVYEKLEKRVDVHDKVVGAVSLAVLILGTLIRYKLL